MWRHHSNTVSLHNPARAGNARPQCFDGSRIRRNRHRCTGTLTDTIARLGHGTATYCGDEPLGLTLRAPVSRRGRIEDGAIDTLRIHARLRCACHPTNAVGATIWIVQTSYGVQPASVSSALDTMTI